MESASHFRATRTSPSNLEGRHVLCWKKVVVFKIKLLPGLISQSVTAIAESFQESAPRLVYQKKVGLK